MEPTQYGDITPREFEAAVDTYRIQKENEQEQRRQELYVSALLISRFVWAKGKLPSYEKVFRKKREIMSDEAMLRMAEALNAAFGGSDKRKEVNTGGGY